MTRLLTLLFGFSSACLASVAYAAPMNSYPKLEIDSRHVYVPDAFPYYDYFVCLKQDDAGLAALEHVQHDPVFRQSLRKVAGEAAARQYRYLNELPEKRAFFSNDVVSDSFPRKEQVPFVNGESYRYSHQYLKQAKSGYQYDLKTKGMYQEMFDRGSDRHWLMIGMTFLQRESVWKVAPLSDIPELVILASLDMKQVQAASSENSAYDHALKSTEFYYFPANPKNCY
ncbi:hypothetical protein LRP49_15885 [Enterovibrio sp. ZSDZ35]|uniref:Uncharacterized protein n=1 Tax=Enterovibrio qingdaonensis TaxID=2899818 RepID=A0ABT5QPX5_9GAMM|nr:hypothetical protein [Enterovibrio sp. ZSDZ35]MDD1782654.1 hypothetical protein [Enterovibrio sp. ZSDZ35]